MIMQVEIPVPPVPPDIPGPVVIHDIGVGAGGISEEALFAIVVICILIGAVYILGPIAKAIARRVERHGGSDPALQEELQSLRERVGEVDQLRERMLELEERVDFAERLLARPIDARAMLPAPEQNR